LPAPQNEGKKKMNAETSKAGTTIWAFDLGKGSIGDPLRRHDSTARAVRCGDQFLHKASLLIPADFAETKTAAGRRRMWRTRQHEYRTALISAGVTGKIDVRGCDCNILKKG
jgi:hypothetical protein